MNLLKVLSYTNAVRVLDCLEEGKRFTDIERDLELNPNVVNMRLKELKMVDLVYKNDKHYEATEKGKKALEIAKELESL